MPTTTARRATAAGAPVLPGLGLLAPLLVLFLAPLPLVGPLPLPGQDTDALPAEDRRLELRLEPLYRVGGLDGEAWEAFQSLDEAAFGRDGRLYLLDAGVGTVVAVGPGGDLLHRLGERGDGPGEYRSPSGIVELPDGRAVVWDFRKRAFLLFGQDGTPLDEVRPDLDSGIPGDPFAVRPDGSLLALPERLLTGRLGHAYFTASGVRSAGGSLPLLRIPLEDGAVTEVITRVSLPEPEGPPPHPVRRAFEALPSWGPLAGGRLALHHTEDYRIEILGPNGVLERVLTRPLGARPTTDADREAYRREQMKKPTRTLGARGGDGVAPDPSDFWYAPVVPPVLAITTDGDGRIWVLRRDPDDPTRAGPVDVLSAQGRYLGTVPREILDGTGGDGLPAAFGPEGRVVFLGTAELDVPVARVYRLPEGLR